MVGIQGLVPSRVTNSGDLEFPEVIDLDDQSGPSARIHELLWGSLSSAGFVPDSDVLFMTTDSGAMPPRSRTTLRAPTPNPDEYSWVNSVYLDTPPGRVNTEQLADIMGVSGKDDHAILSCDSHERVCGSAPRSFYFYDWIVRKVGIEIPFTDFQMKVLGHLNVAPSQLSPGGWGFVVTFEKFCSHLGLEPSLNFFFHLYHPSRMKRAGGKRDAVKIQSAPGRSFVKPVADSYGDYRTKFFRVAVPSGHTVWWEEIADGVVQERFPST